MAKKIEETKKYDEADLKLCREHRKTFGLSDDVSYNRYLYCDEYRACSKGCPLPPEKRNNPPINNCKKCGKVFHYPSRGEGLCDQCNYDKNYKPKSFAGVNRNVFTEIEPEKQDNKIDVKTRRKIESFLWMQARVIDKLSRHPEIYKLLDELTSAEITERLSEVKTSISSVVPAQFGGKMQPIASKETKKMFEKLEKQYAEEDEKKGKKPYNFTEEPKGDWGGLGDCQDSALGFGATDEFREQHKGFFPKKEGEKKKNGK